MGPRPIERRADRSLSLSPTPPRRRGVLGGLVVFAVGFAFFLPAIGFSNALAGPVLFIALGAAFAAAYALGHRQFVYLVPAAVMIALGLGLLVPALVDLGRFAAPAFFGSLAAAFVVVTLLAPERRWPLLPAGTLALIAVAGTAGGVDLLAPSVRPFILPVVLMAVGAYLLVEPSR